MHGSTAAAGDEDGEVLVIVAVAVADAAAEEDQGVVQEGAFAIAGVGEPLNEATEPLDVEAVDLLDLVDHVLIVLMVREVVMAFLDADFGEGAVAAIDREHECADAGGVGLEGQQQHVVHEVHVLADLVGDARGGRNVGELAGR